MSEHVLNDCFSLNIIGLVALLIELILPGLQQFLSPSFLPLWL